MKILITDAYCYMNRGDAGIIIAMIQQLRTAYDNPSITVASLYPDLDQHRYGEGVKVIPAPVLPNHEHNKYKKAIKNVMGALKVRRQLLNNNSSAFLNSCREADLIISCGGGYMQCISLKTFISDFIYHYLQLYCAYYLKKRYVVFAQTIGPFSNKICKIIEPIMNNALYVLPREEYSYKFTKNKFPNSNTV